MVEFVVAVSSSLVASMLIVAAVRIRSRTVIGVRGLARFVSLVRLLHNAGVSNMFISRADYSTRRRERSISEYIGTAREQLTYVGFWLAQGIEMENIEEAIHRLLSSGIRVQVVFLSAKLPIEERRKLAVLLGVSPNALDSRLTESWTRMHAFQNALSTDLRLRFQLREHSERLSSSAFVFDHGRPEAKTLVDFKLFAAGRQGSFGIEFRPVRGHRATDADTLYERMTNSFLKIVERSTQVS